MKKLSYILAVFLILASALPCFAQEKQVVNTIKTWREDHSCGNMELGKFISTYGNGAVSTLKECCKFHKSNCLSSYSSPVPTQGDPTRGKTLLYVAIERKAFEVVQFLFTWAPDNYRKHIDDFGITHDEEVNKKYFTRIEAKGDNSSLTPLMLACAKGYFQGAKFLIENGADLQLKNYKDGETYKNAYDYAEDYVNRTGTQNSPFWEYISAKNKSINDLFEFSLKRD